VKCKHERAASEWAHAGAGAPIPEALARHAAACASCGALVREVTEVRVLFADAPSRRIEPSRREEMRFALMSAARTRPAPLPRRRSRVPAVAALAAAVVAVAAASWVVVRGPAPQAGEPESTSDRGSSDAESSTGAAARTGTSAEAGRFEERSRGASTDRPASIAVVRAVGDARVVAVQGMPDEVHRVTAGAVAFEVEPLAAGERFRVVAGDATVEVRGTRFRVEVRAEHLRVVDVDEGRVLVRIDGRTVADLRDGAHWTRPELAEAPRTPRRHAGARDGTGQQGLAEPAGASASAEEPTPARRADREFAMAWRLMQRGEAARAAAMLDSLAADESLDAGRAAEILYWSARAHLALGDAAGAGRRASQSLAVDPDGWHAAHARELLRGMGATTGP